MAGVMAAGGDDEVQRGGLGSGQFQELLQCVLLHSLHEELIVLGGREAVTRVLVFCLRSDSSWCPPVTLPPPPPPRPIPHNTGPR